MTIITLKEYEYGGKIEVYSIVEQTADDFKKIYACCDYFAKQGAKTLITPRFSQTFGNHTIPQSKWPLILSFFI